MYVYTRGSELSDVIDCCAGGISQHTSIPLVSDGRIDVCADAMEVSGDVAVFFYKLHGEPTATGTDQCMALAWESRGEGFCGARRRIGSSAGSLTVM